MGMKTKNIPISHDYFRENVLPLLPKYKYMSEGEFLSKSNWCPERDEFWDSGTQNLFKMWLIMADIIKNK